MGSVCGCCGAWQRIGSDDQQAKYTRRMKLLFQVIITYVDLVLDIQNCQSMYQSGQHLYAGCLIFVVTAPGIITWKFLYVNKVATLEDLPRVVLQVQPILDLVSSWESGEISHSSIWYQAADGLIESPCASLLTAYIMTFGGHWPWSFPLGIIWSCFACAKAIHSTEYLYKTTEETHVCSHIKCTCAALFRICSLACFGYVLKARTSIAPEEDMQIFSETAIFAWLFLSLTTNIAMIKMVEPRCPIGVSTFFAIVFIFVPPMERFLTVFRRMRKAFIVQRCAETLVMLALALGSLDVNPRVWDLRRNCPFILGMMAVSASGWIVVMVLEMISRSCTSSVTKVRSKFRRASRRLGITELGVDDAEGDSRNIEALEDPYYDSDEETAEERTKITQRAFHNVLSGGDKLMMHLFLNLEGASACDVGAIHVVDRSNFFSKDTKDEFRQKAVEVINRQRVNGRSAKECKSDGWTADVLRDAGYTAMELMHAGFKYNELKKVFQADQLTPAFGLITRSCDLGHF